MDSRHDHLKEILDRKMTGRISLSGLSFAAAHWFAPTRALRYARRRRATAEGRGLIPREPALPRRSGSYSLIESGAPHSSAETHDAQRRLGGISLTAPPQRSQLLSALWLWTYFKNASSSASSMR